MTMNITSQPMGITWSAAPESTVSPFLMRTMFMIFLLNFCARLRSASASTSTPSANAIRDSKFMGGFSSSSAWIEGTSPSSSPISSSVNSSLWASSCSMRYWTKLLTNISNKSSLDAKLHSLMLSKLSSKVSSQ